LNFIIVSNLNWLDDRYESSSVLSSFLDYFFLQLTGNIQQGDENLQLGAKLDDLKIEMDDDEEQGIQGIDGTVRKSSHVLRVFGVYYL
jgi:hypothetical protein